MRSTILAIACIICLGAAAQSQQQIQPTQFDKFINAPSIEWAAYANDTIRFEKFNLNKTLIDRLGKNEIKATLPVDIGEAGHISFISKKSLDEKMLYPVTTFNVIDADGSTTRTVRSDLDFNASSLTDVIQIIYVENKTVKAYIPWASPRVIPVLTSSGISLGNIDYFSSAFNFKYNYQPGMPDKISFLSQTKKMIRFDTTVADNKLKELYGRNLIETLWPYILKGDINAFSFDKNKKLNPNELRDTLLNTTKIAVPVYDANGNISSYIVPSETLSPKVFTTIELVQDWYYDHTKNIVFNKIKAAYLYARKWVGDVKEKEASPILKIVFN